MDYQRVIDKLAEAVRPLTARGRVADAPMAVRPHAKDTLLGFVRDLTGNDAIAYAATVARSEAETGYRNRALANFLKAEGNLTGEIDAVLDIYFHQCALAMGRADLVRAIAFLAREGRGAGGERVVSAPQAKRINALMQGCGTCDAAADMAFRVGIPAKSGVGGGIVAVLPRRPALAVWSSALDKAGNSLAGARSNCSPPAPA